MIDTCPHTPPCVTSRWACGKKTEFGHAIGRGLITVAEANRLLAKMGEAPIKGTKVYRGEKG